MKMFVVLYFVISFLTIANSEELGDSCQLQSKDDGECVLFSQCQSAIRDKQNGIRTQLCGFQGTQPIVCCPKDDNFLNVKNVKKIEVSATEATVADYREIVDGFLSEVKEFPHMVALGYGPRDKIKWLCGGSLISEDFVLTAAHCVMSPNDGQVQWAMAGTINLNEPGKGGLPQEFEIIDRHYHPDYKRPSNYNDIALLRLNKSIDPNEFVYPASLNTEYDVTGKQLEAIGWGKTSFAGTTSNDLLKVDLQLYNNTICNKKYANVSKLVLSDGIRDDLQVCAGGSADDRKDTCLGDSGGPLHELLEKSFFNVYNVIGITSFGKLVECQPFLVFTPVYLITFHGLKASYGHRNTIIYF